MTILSSRIIYLSVTSVLFVFVFVLPVRAGTTSVVTDIAEQFIKKFGVGVGGKTAGEVAETLGRLSTRYGDDVLPFAKVVGHQGLHLLDSLGDDAARSVLALFQRYGGKAGWLLEHEKDLSIALKYGDDAADAIIRHPGLASDVITKFGEKGAIALNRLDTQEARWLTKLLVDDGSLAASGNGDQLIAIVTKYGNAAMDFIWRNKASLAGTAAMAGFLNNPEPYLSGAMSLIVEPISDVASNTAQIIVEDVSWNWIVFPLSLIFFLSFGGMTLIFKIRRQWVNARASESLGDAQ